MNNNPLWAQFQELIQLHKFYFEYFLTAAAFSFGIISAILTYVIKARFQDVQLRLSLVMPLLLSIGTFVIFCIGILKTSELTQWVIALQNQQNLVWRPHTEILIYISTIFAILFFLVSLGIALLMLKPKMLPLDEKE